VKVVIAGPDPDSFHWTVMGVVADAVPPAAGDVIRTSANARGARAVKEARSANLMATIGSAVQA